MTVSPMLVFHICAGTAGGLSGFVAVAFRKGSRRHAIAGNVFVISMLLLAASGAYLAIRKSEITNFMGGVLTFYFLATAWLAARHRHGEKELADWIGLFAIIGIAAFEVISGYQAATSPTGRKYGYPPSPYIIFGTVAVLAALGDFRMLLGRGLVGTQRISRHLWRMCFAWFIASVSIFMARSKVFPAFMSKSGALVFLSFFPLILMVFWLIRVKYSKKFARTAPQSQVEAVPAAIGKSFSA